MVPNVGVGSVTYRGAEICRGINFLFRDEGWGTPPLVLESSVIVKPEDDLHCAQTVSWTSTVKFNGAEIIIFDAQVCVGPAGDVAGAEPTLSVSVTADVLEPCSTARFGTRRSDPCSSFPSWDLPPTRRPFSSTWLCMNVCACVHVQVSLCSTHCATSLARQSM